MFQNVIWLGILRLLFFYLILFACIWFFKKTRHYNIAINCIWFSSSGDIPSYVIENLTRLATQVHALKRDSRYHLYLWTDCSILNPKVSAELRGQGVRIHDFQQINQSQPVAKQTMSWIKALLDIATEKNKFFLCMASDIFRLFLLLVEFPARRRYAYTCYVDCTDIQLNAIPPANRFKKIELIAFRFINIRFKKALLQLLGYEDKHRLFLTNDVIVACTRRKNAQRLQSLYQIYFDHLKQAENYLGEVVSSFGDLHKMLALVDSEIVWILVFATTHVLCIFQAVAENGTFCVRIRDKRENRAEKFSIQDIASVLDVTRVYENGGSWLLDDELDETSVTHADDITLKSLKKLAGNFFLQAYQLASDSTCVVQVRH